MAVTVTLGVPLFMLACFLVGGFTALAKLSLSAWAWLASAGVVHFVIGRYGNYRATRALGATLSAPIQQLSVPISVVLAVFFLDESVTILKLAGFALVMIGPLVALGTGSASTPSLRTSSFRPHYGEGTLWASVGAIGYGISPLLIMKGIASDKTLVGSLAGGLISYSAATLVILLLIAFLGWRPFVLKLERSSANWFLISGLVVFLSQMFRYMALAVAPVSVVVPIQRLSVIFRVVFGWVLNRDHEVFGAMTLTGIVISLLGVMALTVHYGTLESLLPLNWATFLVLEWP